MLAREPPSRDDAAVPSSQARKWLFTPASVLRHHLGAGAFATVYAAIDKEGRPCAVKRIDKYHIKSLESLRNVAGVLRALRAAVGCPNSVWVRGVVASETYLSFVMELFETSNLQEAGAARPQDVRRAAPRIVRGVANGLAHLHARDLHHRREYALRVRR